MRRQPGLVADVGGFVGHERSASRAFIAVFIASHRIRWSAGWLVDQLPPGGLFLLRTGVLDMRRSPIVERRLWHRRARACGSSPFGLAHMETGGWDFPFAGEQADFLEP